MKLVNRVNTFLDKPGDVLAIVAAAIVMFLTLLISADVTMRYFLNQPIPHVTETTEHGLLFITFFGAAWVLKKEGHVRIDVVYNQLSPGVQALFNFVTSILGVIVCLALTWFSAQATWLAFQRGTVFATAWNLPRAPILAVIPIGSFVLFIQFLRQSYENLHKWRLQRSHRAKPAEAASN